MESVSKCAQEQELVLRSHVLEGTDPFLCMLLRNMSEGR